MEQLNNYRWEEPPWKCRYNINEYWEYVKYCITQKTDKLCMVSDTKQKLSS